MGLSARSWKLGTRSCRRLEPRLRLKAAVYLWKRRRLEERWSYCTTTELQRPPFVEGFCGGKGSSRTLTTRSSATGNCSSGLQENGESRRNVECSCSVLHCFLYYNQRFCIRLSSFPSTLTCLPSKWDEETSQETIKVIFSLPPFFKRQIPKFYFVANQWGRGNVVDIQPIKMALYWTVIVLFMVSGELSNSNLT